MVLILKTISGALALAFTASGIKFPADLSDGTYVISTNITTGEDVFTLLPEPEISNIDASTSAKLAKRVTWPSGTTPQCGGAWVQHSDFYDHAYNSFYNACAALGNTKVGSDNLASKYRGAIAFMCDYSGNPCNVAEWASAVNIVNSNCAASGGGYDEAGKLTPLFPRSSGWLSVPAWSKSYGYVGANSGFC